MAKTVRLLEIGGPENLSVDDIDIKDPGEGEVRINVRAIGLNRAETMIMRGMFGQIPLPSLIGYEAVGIIDALGAGVTDFAVGERVAILPGLPFGYGACGETILAPASFLIRPDAKQSDIEAAATWMQFLTAYAIRAYKPVKPGDVALITAASSSVGLAAIQIVRADGGIPVAITRNRSKADALRQHGAAHVICTDEDDLVSSVREITGGRGASVALDAVAGPGFPAILASLGLGGLAIVYGGLGGEPSSFSAPQMSFGNLSIQGFATNYLLADPKLRADALAYVTAGISRGDFRPVIDKVFPLEQISDAYRHLEGNSQIGKIVVQV